VQCGVLAEELGVSRQQLTKEVGGLAAIAINDDLIVSAQTVAALSAEVVTTITSFHQQQPLKNGIDVGTLAKELVSKPGAEVLRYVLRQLVEEGKLRSDREILNIASFDPFASLAAASRKLAVAIERAYLDAGLESPSPQAVLGSDKARLAVYQLLLDTGRLVRLKTYDRNSQMVVHATVLKEAQQAIQEKYPYPASFALKDIRDLLGSTRKYVVPLMEHLDATGGTMRQGDLRRLRE
jgi:selenocysteine-specific elongation factor